MKAVVTGGRGFIGARLLTALRSAGWDAVGLDLAAGQGVRICDVLDTKALTGHLAGADVVVHTAARVGEQGNPELFWRVNVEGTASLLAAAAAAKVGRVVHLSSIVVHGASFPANVDETGPVRPTGNPYTDTKIASEHAALRAAAAGLPVVVVRPGDVYGPGSVPWTIRPVETMKRKQFALIDGGTGMIAPTYVDDLVAGIVTACGVKNIDGEIFQLAGPAVPAREFFGCYCALLGIKERSVPSAVIRGLDPLSRLASRVGKELPFSARTLEYVSHPHGYSAAKAAAVLGWTPATSLADGMQLTADWLRAEGLLA